MGGHDVVTCQLATGDHVGGHKLNGALGGAG